MRMRVPPRIVPGIVALAAQALLFGALLYGLSIDVPARRTRPVLALVTIAPPAPPRPVVVRVRPEASRHRERAAAPNLKARPTPIVAPPPPIPVLPPPVAVAPIAGSGAASRAGDASVAGPGTGAGGQGDGLGGGGDGEGSGGPPRQTGGSISDADYPRELWRAGVSGTVGVRYDVETDGRASGCVVARSSGNGQLDALTCALIAKRFRFAPARDGAGRPIRSTIAENHIWIIDDPDRPPPGR